MIRVISKPKRFIADNSIVFNLKLNQLQRIHFSFEIILCIIFIFEIRLYTRHTQIQNVRARDIQTHLHDYYNIITMMFHYTTTA